MTHASPAIAGLAGSAEDAPIPGALLHAVGSFAATRVIRVVSADANRLTFRHADITTEYFHRASPYTPQPTRTPTNQNVLLPYRHNRLNLDHHEAPTHNRKAGGHVLRKHVELTDEYIECRFTKEKAERAIHKVLRDNAFKIDEWLTKARTGTKTEIEGYISGSGAVVIKNSDRLGKTAQRIRVTIIKKEHNGMAYYVQTVKLY